MNFHFEWNCFFKEFSFETDFVLSFYLNFSGIAFLIPETHLARKRLKKCNEACVSSIACSFSGVCEMWYDRTIVL